ncbi:MAG: zinc ribbon domain-containing protein [Planctomycetes bacterium]|nr:zinc ribbon domain-containing protein [Planctomycetota bacterium]
MFCPRCGSPISPEARFCASCGAPAAVPIQQPPEIDADEPLDEDEAEIDPQFAGINSRIRTSSDVPQFAFTMWGSGCLSPLWMIGFWTALAVLLLNALGVGLAVHDKEPLDWPRLGPVIGGALAVMVLSRIFGRVTYRIGLDPSQDALWVMMGSQLRSIRGANRIATFDLDSRTYMKHSHKGGKSYSYKTTSYRLVAVTAEGRRIPVPQVPKVHSPGFANRLLRNARSLLSRRPNAPVR